MERRSLLLLLMVALVVDCQGFPLPSTIHVEIKEFLYQ